MTRHADDHRDPAYRARVIEGFLRDEYGAGDAARLLRMGTRNFRRLRLLYDAKGVAGLVNGLTGKRSNRAIKPDIRQKVIALLHTRYNGLSARRIARRLAREESIIMSATTLINWMVEEGLWRTRSRKQVWPAPSPAETSRCELPDQGGALNAVRAMLGLPVTERDTLLLPRISGHEEVESRAITLAKSLMIALQRPVTEQEIEAHVRKVDPELHAQLKVIDMIRAHDEELLRRRGRQVHNGAARP